MQHSDFAKELRAGLNDSDPQDSVSRIKAAVRRNLRSLDRTVDIEETGHFNHTFAPDFVLRWRTGASRGLNRPVYLKFGDDADFFAEEIEIVAETKPMVVELTQSDQPESNTERVGAIAEENDTLIANPDAISVLNYAQRENTILRLLDRALVQGGRGLLTRVGAGAANRDLVSGVAGAQKLDVATTRTAAQRLDKLLAGQARGRMSRFLQALWIGSGGSESTYPWRSDLSGQLDDDALAFLIETEGISESDEFWRRVGSKVDMNQIARAPLPSDHFDNLQRLIGANLDRIWARVAKVRSAREQLALGQSVPDGPWWRVSKGKLSLVAGSYEVLVGTVRSQLDDVIVEGRRPAVSDFLALARDRQVPVNRVELVGRDGRVAAFAHEDNSDVAADEKVMEVAESLGVDVTVRSATVIIPSAPDLSVNFDEATAGSHGPGKIPLRNIVLTSVSVFAELDSEDWRLLNQQLPSTSGDLTLF